MLREITVNLACVLGQDPKPKEDYGGTHGHLAAAALESSMLETTVSMIALLWSAYLSLAWWVICDND